MGSIQVIKGNGLLGLEAFERPYYRRLGLINGFLIGAALAFGAWVGEAVYLARLPVRLQGPSLIIGSLLLIIICSLAGWLSSSWAKLALTWLLWLLAAVLTTMIIIYQPSHGRNLVAWLSDSRFWGRPIYSAVEAPLLSIIIAGFAIILILFILAVTQPYRLEGAQRELKEGGRMSGHTLFILLWPMLFVALTGFMTNNNARNSSARDALLVKEAIDSGRTYDGDLFQLSLERGLNFSAISGVREQMSPVYSLLIGGVDAEALTTYVIAHFDNGAWITCRVINGQLNFCYDSAPPYTIGLAALISGNELPEECRRCLPQVDQETAGWLQAQKERLGENPTIERLAQEGSHVLMRVTSKSADQAIECWYRNSAPVELEQCQIVTP